MAVNPDTHAGLAQQQQFAAAAQSPLFQHWSQDLEQQKQLEAAHANAAVALQAQHQASAQAAAAVELAVNLGSGVYVALPHQQQLPTHFVMAASELATAQNAAAGISTDASAFRPQHLRKRGGDRSRTPEHEYHEPEPPPHAGGQLPTAHAPTGAGATGSPQ